MSFFRHFLKVVEVRLGLLGVVELACELSAAVVELETRPFVLEASTLPPPIAVNLPKTVDLILPVSALVLVELTELDFLSRLLGFVVDVLPLI